MPIFNNYPDVTTFSDDDLLLLWQASSGALKNIKAGDFKNQSSLDFAISVALVSDLSAVSVSGLETGQIAILSGYAVKNDGGGGLFYYDSASAAVVENVTVFAADGGIGRWLRVWSGAISALWGGGTTHASLAAADAVAVAEGVPLVIEGGSFALTANLTLSASEVRFLSGGMISGNFVLTFLGYVNAGRVQIFDFSAGSAVFALSKNAVGFPEWWGAETGGTDCLEAIEACVTALQETNLAAADYYISDTLKIQIAGRHLKGQGSQYTVAGSATRLLVAGGSSNVLQLGPDAEPGGGINDFLQSPQVSDLYVSRTVAPVIASGCVGVLSKFTLYQRIHNVRSTESIIGFEFTGTVKNFTEYCYAFRSTVGTGGGADKFHGFYIDGNTDIGAAGGNASIFLNYCNTSIGGIVIADCIGLYADNWTADTFIESFESASCPTGIYVIGDGSASYNSHNTDLQIKNPIIDGFTVAGIRLEDLNKFGNLNISGGFFGPGVGATAAIYFVDSYAACKIDGGMAALQAGISCRGVLIDGGANVSIDGMCIQDATNFSVELSDASSCRVAPVITNNSATLTSAAVQLSGGSTRNYLAPFFSGKANAASVGVNLVGATNTSNEINCTGLDPAAINGGSANKLVINSAQVTTVGLTGTNYASGVMA